MPRSKRIDVERRQARAFLTKSDEFLAAARASKEAGRNDAAMLEAIHAAISATDAVTCALAGIRSTDPDHSRAADLLEEIGPKGEVATHARQLRQLLANKNVVEYESRRTTAAGSVRLAETRRAIQRVGEWHRRRREALERLEARADHATEALARQAGE